MHEKYGELEYKFSKKKNMKRPMGRPDVDGSLLKLTSNGCPYKYCIRLAQDRGQ